MIRLNDPDIEWSTQIIGGLVLLVTQDFRLENSEIIISSQN